MYDRWLNEKRFDYFDGLRAISILCVILYHTSQSFKLDSVLMDSGNIGVDLFFIISGFLITTLLIREKEKYGQINLKNFYIRRILRIFPLYYLLLFFHLFLVIYVLNAKYPVESQQFLNNFKYFFTYTSNWFVNRNEETRTIFYYAWSLAAEEQFYLFWPLILYICVKRSYSFLVIIIVSLLSLLFSPSFGVVAVSSPSVLITILSNIPLAICLGVISALLLHSRYGQKIFDLISAWPVLEISLLAVVLLYILYAYGLTSKLPLLLAMATLTACLATNRVSFISSFFQNNVIVSFGKVSYGLYLYHLLIVNVVLALNGLIELPSVINISLIIIISYFVSYLSYKYFEMFFLEKKKYFIDNGVPLHKAQG